MKSPKSSRGRSIAILTLVALVLLAGGWHFSRPYDVRILMLGNSHTRFNNVPGLLELILESEGLRAHCEGQYSAFLDNLATGKTRNTLRQGNWDAVIFQGQKISMSGKYLYSTEGAEQLSDWAAESKVPVVWFAEWARKDVEGECERIEKVYRGLAEEHSDHVAITGQVWQEALKQKPDLVLHQRDGNHANLQGSYLAALAIYRTLRERDCRKLHPISVRGLPADYQRWCQEVVETVYERQRKRDESEQEAADQEDSIEDDSSGGIDQELDLGESKAIDG